MCDVVGTLMCVIYFLSIEFPIIFILQSSPDQYNNITYKTVTSRVCKTVDLTDPEQHRPATIGHQF